MSITLTNHLIQQATVKGIALDIIREVLAHPTLTYGSFHKDASGNRVPYTCRRCGTPQEKWTGEARGTKVCVVVNPCCAEAVTVWLDQVDTAIRPDQRANGVTGYRGRDGRWRTV